jgi:hypothetical protein
MAIGNTPAFKSFISNRVASITSQLSSLCFASVSEPGPGGEISVYPNPVENQLAVSSGLLAMNFISIYNSLGERVILYTGVGNRQKQAYIDVSNLGTGIYFYSVSAEGRQFTGRFSVIH